MPVRKISSSFGTMEWNQMQSRSAWISGRKMISIPYGSIAYATLECGKFDERHAVNN